MKKKFWTSDKIVSFSAMSISLLTLFIFIKQTNIIEAQSHLSVMPYLMLETSNNSKDGTFKLDLENYGVGPAIIENRVIIYKGKEYDMEFEMFLREHIKEMDSVHIVNYSSVQIGLAIPAGSRRNVLTVGGGQKSYDTFVELISRLQNEGLDYKINYKSIYNDRWKINASQATPIEL